MIEQARNLLINARRGELVVDAITLSHPDLPDDVKITPHYPGFLDYQYVPMLVEKPAKEDNLTAQYKITIQDLGPTGSNGVNGVASAYLDRIPLDTEHNVQVTAKSYFIDIDGNITLSDGPYYVETSAFINETSGVAFTAEPPDNNLTKCGVRATVDFTGGLLRQFS